MKALNKIISTLIVILGFLPLNGLIHQCEALERPTLALYSGPGTPSPLLNIARLAKIEWDPTIMTAANLGVRLRQLGPDFLLEGEVSLAKHWESASAYSVASAVLLRWTKVPWGSLLPGSFAFGNGLSYASELPDLEWKRLEYNSRLLYHLVLEYTFSVSRSTAWEILFRVHHRSGAFGLFGEVVGGSDYLCLGARVPL